MAGYKVRFECGCRDECAHVYGGVGGMCRRVVEQRPGGGEIGDQVRGIDWPDAVGRGLDVVLDE